MFLLDKYVPNLAPEGVDGGGSAGSSPPSSSGSSSPAPSPSGASSVPDSATVAPGTEPRPTMPGESRAPHTPSSGGDSSDVMDFDSIFGDGSDNAGAPEGDAKAKPSAQAAPPAVEASVPPPVPPQAQPQATPAPSPQAATSQPPPSAQAEGAASLDPANPAAIAQALRDNEQAAIDHIAQTMFQLSREDVEALETNAVDVIPKLLARAVVRSQQMFLESMSRSVPAMMGRQVEALRRNAAGQNKFMARWPQLREHSELVNRLAITYRQMNPRASLDQMVEELGPIALMTAKLPLQPPGQPQNPVAQPGPAAANGVRPPQPSPFVPAMGGPGQSPNVGAEVPAWEAMFTHPDA